MAGSDIAVEDYEAIRVLGVAGKVPKEGIKDVFENVYAISAYLKENDIEPAGPLLGVYYEVGEVFDMFVGMPIPAKCDLAADTLPKGAEVRDFDSIKAVKRVYEGSYDALESAWHGFVADLKKRDDIKLEMPCYEVYAKCSDAAEGNTTILVHKVSPA